MTLMRPKQLQRISFYFYFRLDQNMYCWAFCYLLVMKRHVYVQTWKLDMMMWTRVVVFRTVHCFPNVFPNAFASYFASQPMHQPTNPHENTTSSLDRGNSAIQCSSTNKTKIQASSLLQNCSYTTTVSISNALAQFLQLQVQYLQ